MLELDSCDVSSTGLLDPGFAAEQHTHVSALPALFTMHDEQDHSPAFFPKVADNEDKLAAGASPLYTRERMKHDRENSEEQNLANGREVVQLLPLLQTTR